MEESAKIARKLRSKSGREFNNHK